MGSYALYGSTGTAGVMIKMRTPTGEGTVLETAAELVKSTPPPPESESIFSTLLTYLLENIITVVDGKIFIGDVSALEAGSIILIAVSLIGALNKSYYDFTDWKERRRARMRKNKKEQREALDEETATLGSSGPPDEQAPPHGP